MPKSSKLIVCISGSRTINNINFDLFIDPSHVGCVIAGGANGVDTLAEHWAKRNKIEFIAYPARWKIFGKCAGIMRNHEMVEFCDYLIAFWDGKSKGTFVYRFGLKWMNNNYKCSACKLFNQWILFIVY